ncbi:tRNA acetyltransferase TAN1 [Nematocida displodere]|uniref:tRNA acetyltransferase TAN1 n=1 Tax=Nematocida displodere TaxID=1805483 RepID=A0A177EJ59_9MICR|nr:tRNA acetyltransferase TAN1 [Nematocida displodere]
MGGFVVTCVDGGYRKGTVEAVKILELALYSLEATNTPEEAPEVEETFAQQLQRERKEIKKSSFMLLGGNRGSDVLFIRNNSKYSELEIYNRLIARTERVQFIRRVIPVQSIFTLSLANLEERTKELAKCIEPEQTFRIVLKKRLCSHVSTEAIIATVGKELPFQVSLTNPDRIVMVEIARDLCAIGLAKPCPGNFNLTRDAVQQDIKAALSSPETGVDGC